MARMTTLTLVLCLAGCQGDGGSTQGSDPAPGSDGLTVLEGWPDPQANSEVTLPWTIEAQADVVALGTAGEPIEREGRSLLTLRLDEIVFGNALVGEVFPDDDAPFFGCNPPASIPAPSESYPPGSELLIYLYRTEARLAILRLVPRPESLDRVRWFFAQKTEALSAEPSWDQLLALGPEEELYALLTSDPLYAKASPHLAAAMQAQLDLLEGDDAARRPDLELLLQRAGLLRNQEAPECFDALGRLVDWLMARGKLEQASGCFPLGQGWEQASAERKEAWKARGDRLKALQAE